MGGKLLSHYNLPEKRLDPYEYFQLAKEISQILDQNNIKNTLIPSYNLKSSYGDADFLIDFDKKQGFRTWIYSLFRTFFIHHNTDVISFEQKGFQIDFIFTKEENWETSLNYYKYSDLGNLIGRAAHSMGLKYGHRGLEFPIRQKLFDESIENSSDHVIKVVNLSKNPAEILEFLGYSWERYSQGFDTLNDIFLYAASTPYFNSYNFQLENLNHQNRIRNVKRTTFMGFVAWLEKHPEVDKQFHFGDKKSWIEIIDKKWPIVDEIEKCRREFLQHRESAAKLNGNLLMDWIPGLKGKELGKVLAGFREHRKVFSDARTFEDYLCTYSAGQIKSDFLYWFDKFKQSNLYMIGETNS